MTSANPTQTRCYHCGNACLSQTEPLLLDDRPFCCAGCLTVYQVLRAHQLCQYYDLNATPGQHSDRPASLDRFAYLDHPDIVDQLVDFQNDSVVHVTVYIPAIHCSSCLWLLEHLYRLEPGITETRVDFLKKQVSLVFSPAQLSLRQVIERLTSLGYEPLIGLNDVVKETHRPTYRPLLYRLAIAGFCAGNIMLFSFPEYLGLTDPDFKHLFGLLNLLLATPVVFYSASGYFTSVWNSLRQGVVNIDVPILLGILVAYGRGTYEVLALGGAGYYDSVAGLIFFLLCGKWFQQRTYDFLSFERDYTSYFPLAVTRLEQRAGGVGEGVTNDLGRKETDPVLSQRTTPIPDTPTPVPLADLRKGDRVRILHGDLIPADGLLYRGDGLIDYSFVTGEPEPERKEPGALLYAGGRQMGGAIELEIVRAVSQSHLTQLWNNPAFRKDQSGQAALGRAKTFTDAVGTYFTLTVLTLATLIGAYWYGWAGQPATAVNAFTAVLIVACPCVLSLSYPVAMGHGLRLLGKRGFYLKNTEVIEQLSHCDTIVFDKTGTLTEVGADKKQANAGGEILEEFEPGLTPTERAMIRGITGQSAHPLSRQLSRYLADASPVWVDQFTELPGHGLTGLVNGQLVDIGSAVFAGGGDGIDEAGGSSVYVSFDGVYRGRFWLASQLREGLAGVLTNLAAQGKRLYLLSGDSDASRTDLQPWFAKDAMTFGCSPDDKLQFVRKLQAHGHRILMVGDGLNDAGALKQADVGIAITDDALRFTPASDAILKADSLRQLPDFLRYSRFAMRLVRASFGVSLLYNLVGLSFAASGHLSPVVAAVLMPLSSATMVLIATVGMRWRSGNGAAAENEPHRR